MHAATGERTLKIVGTDTTRTRYDSYGNLRDVYLPTGTHVQYAVDAQQRRTARLVNGVVTNRWLYQSQLAIAAEVDSAGNPVRLFNYGAHGNVPELMTLADGTQYRLITDHLGSVRLVIDVAADTVVQRLAYDAYGRVVVDTKPGFQPFGYAGGLYDPLTGLVRFGARDYDAEAGRWTGKDPIGFEGGSPNVYEYALGSPVDFIDITGLRCRPFFERFLENFRLVNRVLPGIAAPSIGPVGIAALLSGATARTFYSPTFLQWARAGFRGLVMGASQFTALETGIVVGAVSLINTLSTAVAFEFGVAIGSTASALMFLDEDCSRCRP